MQYIALLRGVTPTGKNKIPSMAYLSEVLSAAGFFDVRTYIQSGNILLKSPLRAEATADMIHNTIQHHIGAELSVILKTREQLETAARETPFDRAYDLSRIHLVFTNDLIDPVRLNAVVQTVYFGEEFRAGSQCLYMYLPRDAEKKLLSTNYLEKRLAVTATMRKLSVVRRLCELAMEDMP